MSNTFSSSHDPAILNHIPPDAFVQVRRDTLLPDRLAILMRKLGDTTNDSVSVEYSPNSLSPFTVSNGYHDIGYYLIGGGDDPAAIIAAHLATVTK
uniref:Uncharacterized protein n=1 Tax=viral metagenome TaxID=1070528 RepID=A0A6M3IMS8_9ZZZZ